MQCRNALIIPFPVPSPPPPPAAEIALRVRLAIGRAFPEAPLVIDDARPLDALSTRRSAFDRAFIARAVRDEFGERDLLDAVFLAAATVGDLVAAVEARR